MTAHTRRDVLMGAGAALLARPALGAAAFPARNIQFIIPYQAGGGFDNYVRFISPVMERYLPNRVSIVPVNNATGGGTRGITQLYRAKPDGYTLAIFDVPGMFILQQAQGTAAYDLSRFSWLGCMGEGERYFIATGEKSGLKTLNDVKALSAKRPVKFGVAGIEGTATEATIIGAKLLGIRTQLITGYKGSSDYIVAAMRGDCDAVVGVRSTMLRFAKSGGIKLLASFETHSSVPGIPDATTLGIPELDEISIERPVAGPPGLPPGVQATLSGALAKALADPMVVAWAKENYVTMSSKTPEQTAQLIARQRVFFDKWKKFLVQG